MRILKLTVAVSVITALFITAAPAATALSLGIVMPNEKERSSRSKTDYRYEKGPYLDVCTEASGPRWRCLKVQDVIRHVFPDRATEDAAIRCFASESELFKWANRNTGEQYKGVAQMGLSERRQTGWGWELFKQIRSAYRWFRSTGSDFGAWFAPGC